MDKYKVELASPAVKSYENMYRFTAGEDGSQAQSLVALEKLISDILPLDPFSAGVRLSVAALEGVYWTSEKSVHLLYEIYPATMTTVIYYILESPELLDAVRKADMILAQLCISGCVQIMPQTARRYREAAN